MCVCLKGEEIKYFSGKRVEINKKIFIFLITQSMLCSHSYKFKKITKEIKSEIIASKTI